MGSEVKARDSSARMLCTELLRGAKNTAAFILVDGKVSGAKSRLDLLLTAVNAAHIQSEC